MGKIVAIGGGEIGKDGRPIETTVIDQEIVGLSGKDQPRLLFLPTASNDAPNYFELIKAHFGNRLRCITDVLYLIDQTPTLHEIEDKIFGSDIIYVGGGKTALLLKIWEQLGVDRILRQAYENGVIMSGLSAGSICWFKQSVNQNTGLGLINAIHCPHYDARREIHLESKNKVKEVTQHSELVAICLDDCCALEVIDEKYRIIASRDEANAYKVFWKNGCNYEKRIRKEETFTDLQELLKKDD